MVENFSYVSVGKIAAHRRLSLRVVDSVDSLLTVFLLMDGGGGGSGAGGSLKYPMKMK